MLLGDHLAHVCKFKESQCHFCKKKGHIARVCKKHLKEQKNQKRERTIFIFKRIGPKMLNMMSIPTLHSRYKMDLLLCKSISQIEMELDTGAAASLISIGTYHLIQKNSPLVKSNVHLRTYTGQPIPVLGTTTIQVRYETKEADLAVLVVDGEGPNLMVEIGSDILVSWLVRFTT